MALEEEYFLTVMEARIQDAYSAANSRRPMLIQSLVMMAIPDPFHRWLY